MASSYGLNRKVYYDATMASYWENQSWVDAPTLTPEDADSVQCSAVTVNFSRSEAAGVREDLAGFTLHLVVVPGVGAAPALLGATEASAVEGWLDTLWNTIKTQFAAHWILTGYTWRQNQATGPISTKTGMVLPQPAWRTTTRSVAGTAAVAGVPDSSAVDVTFVTNSRLHWGRAYLPAPYYTGMATYGRWTTTMVDIMAGAFDTAFNAMGTNATVIAPVVWSPKYRGYCAIAAVKVDDIPDVIRRRRPKIKTYEKRYNNTA